MKCKCVLCYNMFGSYWTPVIGENDQFYAVIDWEGVNMLVHKDGTEKTKMLEVDFFKGGNQNVSGG